MDIDKILAKYIKLKNNETLKESEKEFVNMMIIALKRMRGRKNG